MRSRGKNQGSKLQTFNGKATLSQEFSVVVWQDLKIDLISVPLQYSKKGCEWGMKLGPAALKLRQVKGDLHREHPVNLPE